MTQTFPRPDWAGFAEAALQRLSRPQGDAAERPAGSGDGAVADRSPLAALLANRPDAQDRAAEMPEGLPADAEAAPTTGAAGSAPRRTLRELLMVIRLAATFGGEAALLSRLQPGAVTLIEGLLPEDLEPAVAVLRGGLLPTGWTLDEDVTSADGPQKVTLVRPALNEGEVSKYGARLFLRKLEDALDREAAVLALKPVGTDLPAVWREGLPKPLPLTPLCREGAVLLLRHCPAVPGGFDEAALRRVLPSDRALATLPFPALRLATRAPTALAAAEHLAQIAAPRSGSEPALRDLAGYGRAKDLAIGIVEDLAAWKRGALPWDHVSRGLLLSGPPGAGKTQLARAMAREGGLTFVAAGYSDWQAIRPPGRLPEVHGAELRHGHRRRAKPVVPR